MDLVFPRFSSECWAATACCCSGGHSVRRIRGSNRHRPGLRHREHYDAAVRTARPLFPRSLCMHLRCPAGAVVSLFCFSCWHARLMSCPYASRMQRCICAHLSWTAASDGWLHPACCNPLQERGSARGLSCAGQTRIFIIDFAFNLTALASKSIWVNFGHDEGNLCPCSSAHVCSAGNAVDWGCAAGSGPCAGCRLRCGRPQCRPRQLCRI